MIAYVYTDADYSGSGWRLPAEMLAVIIIIIMFVKKRKIWMTLSQPVQGYIYKISTKMVYSSYWQFY